MDRNTLERSQDHQDKQRYCGRRDGEKEGSLLLLGTHGAKLPPPPCPAPSTSSRPVSALPHPLLTPQCYHGMRAEILVAAGGVRGSIGDWEVVRIGEQGTRLRVRPSYGASRKISL